MSGHAAIALLLGIFLTYIPKFPSNFFTKRIGSKLLQTGIVFLGGSISLPTVIELNSAYLPWISLFVITTFLAAIFLGKLLGVEKKQAYLLASGTAICGGTAMAAVAPAIKAKPEDLTTKCTKTQNGSYFIEVDSGFIKKNKLKIGDTITCNEIPFNLIN